MTRVRDHDYPGYRPWAFRIWHGMTLKAWWQLLARNRFAISAARIPMAIDITLCAIMNSIVGFIQQLVYGSRIDRTIISVPPVFIIGHWRTGTTWLHEMLALDPRLVAPTTYECFAPSHALLTAPIWILSEFRAPKQRPMDGMRVGYERPQEDEFALLNLGARSFLETLAFPNHRPIAAEYIGLTGLTSAQRREWLALRRRFFKQVLYRGRRDARRRGVDAAALRPVLKCPQDTARLRILREAFPGACFIHLVRDPEDVFGSTVKLWRSLSSSQSLQSHDWLPGADGRPSIETLVLRTFEDLYEDFDEARKDIPPTQFIDVRYEDLCRNPIAELARIYSQFGWTEFDNVRPRLLNYLRGNTSVDKSAYGLSPAVKAQIQHRWRNYKVAFGYP